MPSSEFISEPLASYYREFTLTSAFQPIYRLSDASIEGYEALIRPSKFGTPVPVLHLFEHASRCGDRGLLETTSQSQHVCAFFHTERESCKLFLNLDPLAISQTTRVVAGLESAMRTTSIQPEQIVIEITENPMIDRSALIDSLKAFRGMGMKIAVDDFGAGSSTIERVYDVAPDIVKIDRGAVSVCTSRDTHSPQQRALTDTVSRLHDCGACVVSEGIETEHQLDAARAAGADYVQGYYFGVPSISSKV